jgi:hypothetical protein
MAKLPITLANKVLIIQKRNILELHKGMARQDMNFFCVILKIILTKEEKITQNDLTYHICRI